jgi:SAM-dependent methyltransferase
MQSWKVGPLLKGLLTWCPLVNVWRVRHSSTAGSNSALYCYAVWLRHLVTLDLYGFKVDGARIGELGPGDSIGGGLAALLSGASQYIGLDLVPFAAKANLELIFGEIARLYADRKSIPGPEEFPRLRPRLRTYAFPTHLIDRTNFMERVEKIRGELRTGVNSGPFVRYCAPWSSADQIAAGSLDLVFSQAVLEHVDALEETYQAMFAWLKPGGYASHIIDFSAHHLAPFWNGHWAYSDLQWRLVRGRREFLLNREPLGTHLSCATKAGFEMLLLKRDYGNGGLSEEALAPRFQAVDAEDLRTRGAVMIMRKPPTGSGWLQSTRSQ